MADQRWPPFGNHDLIITSYGVITSHSRPQGRHHCNLYLSSKSHCHSFYSCEDMEGYPPQKTKKTLSEILTGSNWSLITLNFNLGHWKLFLLVYFVRSHILIFGCLITGPLSESEAHLNLCSMEFRAHRKLSPELLACRHNCWWTA